MDGKEQERERFHYNRIEQQGDVVVITQMTNVNRKCRAVKVSKDSYMDTETGEVHEYRNRSENRTQNRSALRKTFQRIRGLINANAPSGTSHKVKFITLTYAENMTDPKRLYRDFSSFWKRFLYWHEKQGHDRPEYLLVVEPQERGAWHGHLLLFYPKRAPFIPFEVLEERWGHGFVFITDTSEVRNLSAYLSAYLTDIPVDAEEGEEWDFVDDNGVPKKILKGGRLHLYPTGMNIYRCSRGLKKPKTFFADQDMVDNYRFENDEEVSGGQKAEYLFFKALDKAATHDTVLIDEPESSFDNPYLNELIVSELKKISERSTVFIATHNNVLGVSIDPDGIVYTAYEDPEHRVYTGDAGDEKLVAADGRTVNRSEMLLKLMEAGDEAYKNRKPYYGIT